MVPLFGDMQIAPFNFVRRSKNFDPAKWPLANTNQTHPQSDLLSSLQQIRDDHLKYISELARYSNEVRRRRTDVSLRQPGSVSNGPLRVAH